jgi:hypothetical protein
VEVEPEGVGKPPLSWALPLLVEPDELEELLELALRLEEDDPEAPEVGALAPEELLGVVGAWGVVGVDALGQPARTRQAQLSATGSTRRRMWR